MKSATASDLNEHKLRDLFARSADVTVRSFAFGPSSARLNVLLMYCDGMADTKQIDETVLPGLYALFETLDAADMPVLERVKPLQLQPISGPDSIDKLTLRVFSGELGVFIEETGLLYSLNISKLPNRTPEESSAEVSIKGPRDAFTESLVTNVALIRKRMKTTTLCCEYYHIGVRSRTSVALLYIDDVIRPEVVEEARRRLSGLNVDGLISSGQLEEGLSGRRKSLFPLLDYVGRPDYASDCLLRGRFAVLVDGSPMAVIAPANLLLILKSPEDVHFPFYFVSFERILRLVGLLIALFLPGFWIAVSSFNLDQIPMTLLATIASSRLGIPFSGSMDFYIMLTLFELFREAGMRLPKAVGQTVAVLGGLIIGDAAIRAGITSPITLVVAATSTISMFSLVNQSLAGTITVLRVLILIASSFLGVYGFILTLMGLALYLATLETFGVPYCAPLSPPNFRDMMAATMARPWKTIKRRPTFLNTNDNTRRRGDSSD